MFKRLNRKNWKKVNFGYVALQIKDRVEREKTGLQYYLGGEHFDCGEIHIKQKGVICENPIGPAFHMRFKPGHVLLVSRNPHLRKASLADFEGICANTTYVCEAVKDEISSDFLPFLMQSDAFWYSAELNKRGSTNPYLNWGDFAKFKFELPPIPEQKRFADLLWSVDEVIESYSVLLSKLVIARNSLLKNRHYDKGHKPRSISAIAEINPRINRSNISKNAPVSFVTMSDVSGEGFIVNKCDKKYSDVQKGFTPFEENDILFAKITPCMENNKGAIASNLTNSLGFGSTEFHVIRPKNPDDRYYLFCLSRMFHLRKKAEQLMTGSAGQKRVPSDFFDYYKISFPDEKKRKKLGDQLLNCDVEIENLKKTIDLTKNIQRSIINQIFG